MELQRRVELVLTEVYVATYQFDINQWQRHVDVDIPANERRPEASVHVARSRYLHMRIWVGYSAATRRCGRCRLSDGLHDGHFVAFLREEMVF